MNFNPRQELETREPEKTPLIDMVFLLLIFFFVNLAVRSEPAATRTATLPSDVQAELPKVPTPDPAWDSSAVLLEVLDTQVPSVFNRLEALHKSLRKCAASCKLILPPSVEAHRFWVTTVRLDALESVIQNTQGCDCSGLQWVTAHFPIPLDDRALSQQLNARLNALPGTRSLRLHVRMPRSTPVSFLATLYDLANENGRIDPKYVFVRALEERM